MIPKGCNKKSLKVFGRDVLCAHLNNAWGLVTAGRE